MACLQALASLYVHPDDAAAELAGDPYLICLDRARSTDLGLGPAAIQAGSLQHALRVCFYGLSHLATAEANPRQGQRDRGAPQYAPASIPAKGSAFCAATCCAAECVRL